MARPRDSARGRHPDLLARPPCGARGFEHGWAALAVDPAAQIRALAELLKAGLLSEEEFERQKAKALSV